jgi:hypothetical protein
VKGQGVLSLPWAALSTCCLVFCCFAGACAVPLVSMVVVALRQAEPTDGTTCSQSAIWRRGHYAQTSASIKKRAVLGECRRALVVECRLRGLDGANSGTAVGLSTRNAPVGTGAAKPIARHRRLPVVEGASKGEHNVSRRFRAVHKRSRRQSRAKAGPSLTPQLLRGTR